MREKEMTKLLLTGIAAALIAPAALADPVTRTITIDTPKYEGTKTITRDKEEGTLSRDAELTRKGDGAVATREYDRQRTDTGVTASGSTTRFNGDTRSFDYERTRTAHGYDAEGTLTRFNGQSYDYTAKLRRGEYRVGKSQVLRNSSGQVVAARRVVRPRRH
jgi:hypothetical protein